MAFTFTLLAIVAIYGKYMCIPTFELSNPVLLLAKQLPESKGWMEPTSRNHLLSGNHLPSLKQIIKSRRELDRTR